MASFETCLAHGCDGFEFDVRLAGDGQAVICHDPSFDGVLIAETPADALAVPALDHVLRQFARRAFLDIELKVAGLELLLLAALRRDPPQKGCVVSSFLPEVLTTIHRLDPVIPLGLLCETEDQLRAWRQTPAEWVIPQSDLVIERFAGLVHSESKKIMVWTVNREARMLELAEWGVDAIISDETELLVRSLP